MGWGGGSGKKQVLDPASGGLRSASEDGSPFKDRFVLIDISGLAHRAAKQQPVTVAREGVSVQQQQYVRRYLESVVGEGGRPVVVLDGKAYPPKAATRATRRADQAQARASADGPGLIRSPGPRRGVGGRVGSPPGALIWQRVRGGGSCGPPAWYRVRPPLLVWLVWRISARVARACCALVIVARERYLIVTNAILI